MKKQADKMVPGSLPTIGAKKLKPLMLASLLDDDEFAAQMGMTTEFLHDALEEPLFSTNYQQIEARAAWIFGVPSLFSESAPLPEHLELRRNYNRWFDAGFLRSRDQQVHVYQSLAAWRAKKEQLFSSEAPLYVCPECRELVVDIHHCDVCGFEFALNEHKRVGHPFIKTEAYRYDGGRLEEIFDFYRGEKKEEP